MTQRECHTADGGAPKVPPPAGRAASSVLAASSASVWEEWYLRASPEQRQTVLALAAQQGVLQGCQLSDPNPGHAATPKRSLLSALLTGQVRELEPLYPPSLIYQDTELDPVQREAVARAVATPDIFLLRGAPGTGKSRVAAEILAQAVARGERVLLLAPSPAALDRILELLGTRESVLPLRCLSPGELLDSLPICVRRLTLADRQRVFEQQTLPAAQASLQAAEQRLQQRQQEEPLWERLAAIAICFASQAEQRIQLEKQFAGVAAAVAAELALTCSASPPGPLPAAVADLLCVKEEKQAQLDAQLALLRAEVAKVHSEKDQAVREREAARPLIEARQNWRIFSPAYWRAWLRKLTPARLEELNQRIERLIQEEQRLTKDIAALEAESSRVEKHLQDNLEQLRAAEVTRQQAHLEEQIAAVQRSQAELLQEWQSVCRGLGEGVARPDEIQPEAVRAAREAWDQQRHKETQILTFARDWAQSLEATRPHLADRLAECANIVAATTTGLFRDPYFGERSATPVTFDLLLLEDAHEVTESDFLHAARHACRWVLVGMPGAANEMTAPPARKLRQSKAVPPPALRPGFFQRLWQTLHDDPHRLSRSWFQRHGRLVCRLRHIAESDERSLQSEWVADRPDIELRILDTAAGQPELAEVVFPATWSLSEAKSYIFRELDEVRVDPHGHTVRCLESAEAYVFQFVDNEGKDLQEVTLGPGLREWIGPVALTPKEVEEGRIPWRTYRIELDRREGWTRERAERWIEQHLHVRPLGRTAQLTVAHRMEPALGAVLAELLGGRALEPVAARPSGLGPPSSQPFQFVSIPDSSEQREGRRRAENDQRRRGGAATLAARAGSIKGAGLETDLAEPHRPDQLPGELRALLPHQGLVNYLEASALVRALQDLLADPAFLHAAAAWQRQRALTCACLGNTADHSTHTVASTHCPTIAIIALYPAQVELIRRLISDMSTRTPSTVRIEIGLPCDFHQRECLIALVSLTRSHTHRAVSFGESPQQLVLALTRAVSRLWVFGDPGTLARRCQWSGPLDHLDDSAAEQERDLIQRLCQLLPGATARAADFRSFEGSGV